MHMNSSVQRLASSASPRTSFTFFRMQNKSYRKVIHRLLASKGI